MPNLIGLGISNRKMKEIIDHLLVEIPVIMDDAVFDTYPEDAPAWAKRQHETAPYLIIRDTKRKRALKIGNIVHDFVPSLDIEVEKIDHFIAGKKTGSSDDLALPTHGSPLGP